MARKSPSAADKAKVLDALPKNPMNPPVISLEDLGINPPDLDGDGKPGGSLSQLAWDCAETAWASVFRWAKIKQVPDHLPWADLSDDYRLMLAIDAERCMNLPDLTPTFPPEDDRWESTVRGKIFAAVVRSIAL